MKKLLSILMGVLLVATPALAQSFNEIPNTLQQLGFGEVLIWLLTFAIVYGVLSHAGDKGVPRSQAARAIIAFVLAFLVLFAVPGALVNVLSSLSRGLVLVLVGLLVLIVILEFAVGKTKGKIIDWTKDKETGRPVPVYEHGGEAVSILQHHGKWVAIALLIIAALLFVGAGGLALLGISTGIALSGVSLTSIIILVIIVLAVLWIIRGE